MKRNTSTPLNYKTNRVIRGHARLYTPSIKRYSRCQISLYFDDIWIYL